METNYPSPDGSYIFQIDAWEARMSLWVETPTLMATRSGQSVFSFKDGNWSLDDAEWLDNQNVKLFLRKYPGDHPPTSIEVVVDCQHQQASLLGGPPITLDALEAALEAMLKVARRE